MKNQKFSIKSRLKSFGYALNGLKILIRDEHNSRIHLGATVLAVFIGFFLEISSNEWIAIIIVIGFVFSMEIINSAIEYLANFVSPDYHVNIKKIKDLSAAAVLVSAIVSIIVASIIFIPKIVIL